MNSQQEIARLRDRLQAAERTIRELKGEDIILCIKQNLNLSWQRAQILAILLRRERVSRESLLEVLYNHNYDINPKIIDVLMCHIRKKVRPYGIHIGTIWGFGFYLSPTEKTKLCNLLRL